MSPYDELTELRSVLTVQEIAEVTGLRRETLSRARRDSRFHRRTRKALDDLYSVVVRLRPEMEGDTVHLAAVMQRPQAAFDRRSIADLLQEGRVDQILEHLVPVGRSEEEQVQTIRLDPEIAAQMSPTPGPDDHRVLAKLAEDEERVARLLAADPELATILPPVEEAVRRIFGDEVRIRPTVVADHDDPEAPDHLHLGVRTDLPFDDEIDRLGELLVAIDPTLNSVRGRLSVGNL